MRACADATKFCARRGTSLPKPGTAENPGRQRARTAGDRRSCSATSRSGRRPGSPRGYRTDRRRRSTRARTRSSRTARPDSAADTDPRIARPIGFCACTGNPIARHGTCTPVNGLIGGLNRLAAEVAVALGERRHVGDPRDAFSEPRALVVGKEKQAIFHDRAAERGAVLMTAVLRRRLRSPARSSSSR